MALQAKYTDQLVVRVSPELRAALVRIADREEVAVASVVRDRLLLSLEEHPPVE